MNIYHQKKKWKYALFGMAVLIVVISFWYTSIIVSKFARDEVTDVTIWADAIQRKAKLVRYTEVFFEQIKAEERKRAETLAGAYKIIGSDVFTGDFTFYMDIIKGNTTIPVILTDEKGNIASYVNYEFKTDTIPKFTGKLRREFSQFPPIEINYYADKINYLYYKESTIFTELRGVLNDLVQSFFSEVVLNSASVPVIVTDSTGVNVISFGNIDSTKMQDSVFVNKILEEMKDENTPIELKLLEGNNYVYYKSSALLTQMQYYPYIQFGIIALFILIAYFLFSSARRAEQNRVWVGMSKETAHQIGTPLSSIMAWLEILKMKGVKDEAIDEIDKDVSRLEKITERFSKIGSVAKLEPINIVDVVYDAVSYFKSRSSKKVIYEITPSKDKEIKIPLNRHLFEWVIENLCKNAIDAMGNKGTITIEILDEPFNVIIDFSDTGKGIPKTQFKNVFNPGYTSKKRGWGLGLTLTRRIVNEYHKGKIFVKNSGIDEGTTFRIILNK